MDTKDINRYSIREYLAGLNIHPVKDRGYYGMFRSPFREDNNASMKVDYDKNLWIDYGANAGGTLIDLVMWMEDYSTGEAIRLLERQLSGMESFSFHRNREFTAKENVHRETSIRVLEIKSLEIPALLDYLKVRSINPAIAVENCREIHYSVNGRPYYGIGFGNMSGGYEIRNPCFKGCIGAKDITHIRQEDKKASCFVFEGFMDYLSLLTIRHQNSPEYPCTDWQDYIILNSTANLPKALERLAGYEEIHCFLDNDTAGRAAYRELEKEFGCRIRDASHHYPDYKDLNEYLCGKRCTEDTGLKRQIKPISQSTRRKKGGLKI